MLQALGFKKKRKEGRTYPADAVDDKLKTGPYLAMKKASSSFVSSSSFATNDEIFATKENQKKQKSLLLAFILAILIFALIARIYFGTVSYKTEALLQHLSVLDSRLMYQIAKQDQEDNRSKRFRNFRSDALDPTTKLIFVIAAMNSLKLYHDFRDKAMLLDANQTETSTALSEYRDNFRDFRSSIVQIHADYHKVLAAMDSCFLILAAIAMIIGFWAQRAYTKQSKLHKKAIMANKRVIHDIVVPALVIDARTHQLVDANAAALDLFHIDDINLNDVNISSILPNYLEAVSPTYPRTSDSPVSSCPPTPDWSVQTTMRGTNSYTPNQKQRKISNKFPDRPMRRKSRVRESLDTVRKFHLQGHMLGQDTSDNLQLRVHKRTVMSEDGTTVLHWLIMNDISDEMEIQKKILAQFTHEMRNKYVPATSMLEHVLSMSAEDNKKSDTEIRQELVAMHDDIKVSTAMLYEGDQLVKTRLNLHKVFNGTYKSEPNVQTCSLHDLMSARIASAAALAVKHVEFIVQLPPNFGQSIVHVRLDEYVFTHIADNLLSNARKHTSQGTILFRFVGETEDEKLEFAVVDSGDGISPEIASRLFEEEVHTGDCRGVGLGLISCHRFAACIGGSVWLAYTKRHRISRGSITSSMGSSSSVSDGLSGSDFRFVLPGKIISVENMEESSHNGDSIAPVPPEGMMITSDDNHSNSQQDSKIEILQQRKLPPSSQETTVKNDVLRLEPLHQDRNASVLRMLTKVYIVEDSSMIRKTIIMKLKGVWKRANLPVLPEWFEFDTVEALLAHSDNLNAIRSCSDLLITLDENLDSQGGVLRGTDLIQALVNKDFRGIMCSISGDDATASIHKATGAHIILGKPLPKNEVILDKIKEACTLKLSAEEST